MKIEEFNDITIIIGQNAQENWNLINFDCDYIWLHLNSFPSCHVIIEDNNPEPEVLEYAAQLCKENTKYRNLRNLRVNYTLLSNITKAETEGAVYMKSKRKVNNIVI